jgi:hypothetical protein
MPPKFTPRAPQVGRYWPGKPLKNEEESSSDEEEEEQEREQQQIEKAPSNILEDNNIKTAVAGKLVTTMKTTSISEHGPYMPPEEESSESESEGEEEEDASQPEKQSFKIRQARRRAVGDFIAADRVDLEQQGEVFPMFISPLTFSLVKRSHLMRRNLVRKKSCRDGLLCVQLSFQSTSFKVTSLLALGLSAISLSRTETT